MKKFLFVGVTVVSLGCVKEESSTPQSRRFSAPRGFAEVKEGLQGLPVGSYAFTELSRSSADAFLGSIVVAALGNAKLSTSQEFCDDTARAFAKRAGVLLDSSQIVTLAGRAVCQIQGRAPDRDTIHVEYTILHPAAGAAWGITCNFDSRDEPALKACDDLLSQWRG